MNEIDIASFAENLLEQEIEGGKPVQFAAPQAPDAPDVSEVEVPDDFASQVLTEGHWDKAQINVEVTPDVEKQDTNPQPKPEVSISLNEDSLYQKHLLNEYKKTVSELEELINLMEQMGMMGPHVGVGNLGVGVSSPGLSVHKRKGKKKKGHARTARYNR